MGEEGRGTGMGEGGRGRGMGEEGRRTGGDYRRALQLILRYKEQKKITEKAMVRKARAITWARKKDTA